MVWGVWWESNPQSGFTRGGPRPSGHTPLITCPFGTTSPLLHRAYSSNSTPLRLRSFIIFFTRLSANFAVRSSVTTTTCPLYSTFPGSGACSSTACVCRGAAVVPSFPFPNACWLLLSGCVFCVCYVAQCESENVVCISFLDGYTLGASFILWVQMGV